MTMNVYFNNWAGPDGLSLMCRDFEINPEELEGAVVLLASYGTGSYEGDAFVLFERGGVLWEVNGSHCSCYGLEGQWQPEETSAEALRVRLAAGGLFGGHWCGGDSFHEELLSLIDGRL